MRITFPEILEEDLSRINPWACSYDELCSLSDACKSAVRDEVDSLSSPDLASELLHSAEKMIVRVALQNDIPQLVMLNDFANEAKKSSDFIGNENG